MFLLYPVVIGLLAGFLVGGRMTGLAELRFRWAPAILLGLLTQVVLFSDAVAERAGDLGPPVYVASTLLVFAAILRNVRIPGLAIVAAGAASNLAAILANGGFMPAGRGALEALGILEKSVYSNSAVVPEPALWPLTDIFAMPAWLPGANIFSIGDVLIGVGIVAAIVISMRRRPAGSAAGDREQAGGGGDRAQGPDLAGAPGH